MLSFITENSKGIILTLKILPNAKKNSIESYSNDYLKIKISAPPRDSKANQELLKFLSKTFNISKSKISIIKGEKSRNKTIEIAGIDKETIENELKKWIEI